MPESEPSMTNYVVLREVPVSDITAVLDGVQSPEDVFVGGGDGRVFVEVGEWKSASADTANRRAAEAIKKAGVFVAVPERSFSPTEYVLEIVWPV